MVFSDVKTALCFLLTFVFIKDYALAASEMGELNEISFERDKKK